LSADAPNYGKKLLQQPQGEIALVELVRNFSHQAVNFSIAVGLFFLIRWAVHVIVGEIAHAQH